MSYTGYVVDSALLASMPSGHIWHASQSPSDPTKSLLAIQWENSNDEIAFESQAGVIPLGNPWETLPLEAADVVASFQPVVANGKVGIPVPLDETPDTVAQALRKARTVWPGAGLIR